MGTPMTTQSMAFYNGIFREETPLVQISAPEPYRAFGVQKSLSARGEARVRFSIVENGLIPMFSSRLIPVGLVVNIVRSLRSPSRARRGDGENTLVLYS